MKNILIVNQHTCNRGDEAAGRAVIDSLLKTFPDFHINVTYRWVGKFPAIWENSDRVTHRTDILSPAGKSLKTYLEYFLNILFSIFRAKIYFGEFGKICKLIDNSDLVVNAPTGPNIGDIYQDKVYTSNLLFAVLRGKKTVMYGSSVGPFVQNKKLKFIAKFIFERMDFVCVRDEISFGYLKSLKLKNKNLYSSLDAAIQRKIDIEDSKKYYETKELAKNKYNIGITPLAYPMYPKAIRNPETQEIVEQNLVLAINKLTENNDVNIYFFPQLFSLDGKSTKLNENDNLTIESIISKVNKPQFCKIVPNEYDSDIQQKMISELNYFIGMRYHSIIFATKMNVPCVGIYYEHKAKGFMEKVGIIDLGVSIDDFINKSDLIMDKLEYISNNEEIIRQKIRTNMIELAKLSSKGTELILKHCVNS